MSHGDYTGALKTELAAQARLAQEQAQGRLAMATAEIQQRVSSEVVDLTPNFGEGKKIEQPITDENDQVVEVREVNDPEMSPKTFRASENLDGVTLGKDITLDLVAGQQYRLPKWAYDHLDRIGLVFHH